MIEKTKKKSVHNSKQFWCNALETQFKETQFIQDFKKTQQLLKNKSLQNSIKKNKHYFQLSGTNLQISNIPLGIKNFKTKLLNNHNNIGLFQFQELMWAVRELHQLIPKLEKEIEYINNIHILELAKRCAKFALHNNINNLNNTSSTSTTITYEKNNLKILNCNSETLNGTRIWIKVWYKKELVLFTVFYTHSIYFDKQKNIYLPGKWENYIPHQ